MKRVAVAALLIAVASGTFAGDGQVATPLRDPWVPPAARPTVPIPETRGEALRAQVEHKLRADFDRADTGRNGSITREQARAARLAAVEQDFDAIDTARKGRVTFDDYKRFLRSRGARTL